MFVKQPQLWYDRSLIHQTDRHEMTGREAMTALFACNQLKLTPGGSALSLEIAQGEIILISVDDEHHACLLLQTIIGECSPAAGELQLYGHSLAACSREELLRLRSTLAVVSPQVGLIANLKLWENIMLPLLYHQGEVQAAADQATQLLDRLDYRGNIWALPGHLTPSERIITSFIRAAVASPELVIYAGFLPELTVVQRTVLLQEIITLHSRPAAPAALFISVGDEQPEGLQLHRQYELCCRQSTEARESS